MGANVLTVCKGVHTYYTCFAAIAFVSMPKLPSEISEKLAHRRRQAVTLLLLDI